MVVRNHFFFRRESVIVSFAMKVLICRGNRLRIVQFCWNKIMSENFVVIQKRKFHVLCSQCKGKVLCAMV